MFAIKKAPKSSLKLQIYDDTDLIDEDSLLTEEDLKKPELLPGKFAKPDNMFLFSYGKALILIKCKYFS